jgi:hypothetical protein
MFPHAGPVQTYDLILQILVGPFKSYITYYRLFLKKAVEAEACGTG